MARYTKDQFVVRWLGATLAVVFVLIALWAFTEEPNFYWAAHLAVPVSLIFLGWKALWGKFSD